MNNNFFNFFKLLFILLFLNSALFSQQNQILDQDKSLNQDIEKDNQDLNTFIGKWKVSMSLYELFGDFYEAIQLKDTRYKNAKFLSSIEFIDQQKGNLVFDNDKNYDFEYEIKDNNLKIAYGSLLDISLDLYKFKFNQDNTLFIKSSKLSYANGIMYLILRKISDNSNLDNADNSQNEE